MSRSFLVALALFATVSTPCFANSLVGPGPRTGIAKSRIAATATGEWNKLSRSDGKNVEVWTLDGDSLNKVTFFGGIAAGKSLLRERNKNSPLPKVAGSELVTDIPVLLETTYRSQFSVNQMAIETQEPADLDGHAGIRFSYSFTRGDDEVLRKGEAVGAMVDGTLYLISYEAPAIYFFDKDVAKFRNLAATIKL